MLNSEDLKERRQPRLGTVRVAPDGQWQVGKMQHQSARISIYAIAVSRDLVQAVCPVNDDESMQYERKEHV